MLYEYQCTGCKADALEGKEGDTIQEVFSHKRRSLGHKMNCQLDGCRNKMKRVMSHEVAIIIKGKVSHDLQQGETLRTRINGEEMRFRFLDHKHTDPERQRNLLDAGRKAGISQNSGLEHAQIDEKTGKLCVEVVSNVPDPLGKMDRAIKKGGHTSTTKVNTPTRRRRK